MTRNDLMTALGVALAALVLICGRILANPMDRKAPQTNRFKKRTLVAKLFLIERIALVFSAVRIASHYKKYPNFSIAKPPTLAGNRGEFDPEKFEPRIVIPNPLPAITEIPVKQVSDVTDEISDEDLVLGVEVSGKFRAYPINQLTGPAREIFNDELGGIPIAATW